jgi:hypothetical protein
MFSSEYHRNWDVLCDGDSYVREKENKDEITRQTIERGHGRCYEDNYEVFQELKDKFPHLKYVVVKIRYKKSGNKITHAFVQEGRTIIDESQGNSIRVDLEDYLNHDDTSGHQPCDILSYYHWGVKDIPSIEYIRREFGQYEGQGHNKMKKGCPTFVGKWELSAKSVL